MELQEHGGGLKHEIAFWLIGLRNPKYPIGQLGELGESLSDRLRALAIIQLLTEGDTDKFLHNLARSGMALELYLRRARDEGALSDFHRAISRSTGMVDTIAAGHFDLARRIVALSPDKWIEQGEYEDDFCFMRCLHLFVEEAAREQIEAVLERFDKSSEGAAGARLTVCRALVERDQAKFDEAIEARIVEYEGFIEDRIEGGEMEEAHVVPRRHVFVEGLAFLRLADRRGLRTDKEYRRCPALARLPMKKPFPAE